MTGKGSEIITQGHRCSAGVGCLLFGSCCQSRFSKRKWGEIAKLKGWSNCGLLQRPLASQPSPSPSSFNPHPLFRVQSLGLLPGKPAGHFFTHLQNNSPSRFPAFSRRGWRDVGRAGAWQHRAGGCLCFPSLLPAAEWGCDLPPARASDLEDEA